MQTECGHEARYGVIYPGGWENENSRPESTIKDWWAIFDEKAGGIIAYAQDEETALFIVKALTRVEGTA